MKFTDLPIKEGINFAGSICSIVAVVSTLTIHFDVWKWFVILIGLLFGVCCFGLFISIAILALKRYEFLKTMSTNIFALLIFWSIVIILSLLLSIICGVFFGGIVQFIEFIISSLINSL